MSDLLRISQLIQHASTLLVQAKELQRLTEELHRRAVMKHIEYMRAPATVRAESESVPSLVDGAQSSLVCELAWSGHELRSIRGVPQAVVRI